MKTTGSRKRLQGRSSGISPSDDDFSSLFTTMLGICTLLEEKMPEDPEIGRYLGLLRSSVERAVSLSRRGGR